MIFEDIKEFDRKTGLVFHGCLSLPLIGFIYFYLEISQNDMVSIYKDNEIISWGLLAASSIIAWFTYSGYRHRIGNIREQDKLGEKLDQLYGIYKRMYFGFFACTLLLVVGYYLTGSVILLIGFVFVLFLLSIYRPAKHRYVLDLPLSKEEKQIILDGGEILQ